LRKIHAARTSLSSVARDEAEANPGNAASLQWQPGFALRAEPNFVAWDEAEANPGNAASLQ
jgi:hypothetical protein